MIEDKELPELLGKFSPEQTSVGDIMARLQNRMDTVDLVNEQIAVERRLNHKAVII